MMRAFRRGVLAGLALAALVLLPLAGLSWLTERMDEAETRGGGD